MKEVFDLLIKYCKSSRTNKVEAFEEAALEVKQKKRNKGCANVEIANRKRRVGKERQELGF
jgi:hypothetical protein